MVGHDQPFSTLEVREIAVRARVSPGTVADYLNQRSRTRDVVVVAITSAMRKLGFSQRWAAHLKEKERQAYSEREKAHQSFVEAQKANERGEEEVRHAG